MLNRSARTFAGVVLAVVSAMPVGVVTARDVPTEVGTSDLRGLGRVVAQRHRATGLTRLLARADAAPLLRATEAVSRGTPEAAARSFLASHGHHLGVRDAARDLRVQRQTANQGRTFVRFQQLHRGVPVIAGDFVVQLTSARDVITASGEGLADLALDVTPRVTAADAARIAVGVTARAARRAGLHASRPQLSIYDPSLLGGPGAAGPRLVWRTEVTGTAGDDVREFVLVDAVKGHVALQFNQLAHAKNRRVCDQKDSPTTGTAFPCKSPYARSEGGVADDVTDVNLAYDYSGNTYDFFKNRFGRDSLDGAGMPLVSTVRYCPDVSDCPYGNAFWDGKQMTYGAGYAAADDVVGHELTHGVTHFSSGLFYYYQSGAINEALSDIFGEFIDQLNGRGTDGVAVRWHVGEDIPGGALRNMANPPALGQPDRIRSARYEADPDGADAGGVHTNSGIANKAAYLMVEPGTRTFNGRTVTAIGLTKAAAVWYHVNEHLLTSGSDYNDLYDLLQVACSSLIGGKEAITNADCTQVKNAAAATEMHLQPTVAAAVDAQICPTAGGGPLNTFIDDMENAASGKWTSASLKAGAPNTWYNPQNQRANPYTGWDPTYATSGRKNAWGDDYGGGPGPGNITDSVMQMTNPVTVPIDGYLHFRHAYGFDDFGGDGLDAAEYYDGGVLEYRVGTGNWQDAGPLTTVNGYRNAPISNGYGNPLAGRKAFAGESNGYVSTRVNLKPLEGKQVRFRFRLATDDAYGDYGWFIDDVRIYRCDAITDTVAPVGGSVKVNADAPNTRTAVVSVTAPATDARSGVSRIRISSSPTTSGTQLLHAAESRYTTPVKFSLTDPAYGGSAANGPKTVYVQWRDKAGNWSAVSATTSDSIFFDNVVPNRTAPVANFKAGTRVEVATSSGIPVRVAWTAIDPAPASGIKQTALQRRLNSGAFTTVPLPSALAREVTLGMASHPSNAHQFQDRATDAAGNVSTFALGAGFKLQAFQDSSASPPLTYTPTWADDSMLASDANRYYGMSVKHASAAGAKATFTFTGTDVALVTTYGADGGKAEVWVDDVKAADLDLYRAGATPATRRIAFSRHFASSGTHTIELKVLGAKNASSTGTRVDLDAFLVLGP